MSYAQMMKWVKKHPKRTHQTILMHTNSGFWPSGSWLENDWWPFVEKCKREGRRVPCTAEEYYKRPWDYEEVKP